MTPIATIIKNRTMNSRFVNWTGATKTWLVAGGTVEVPFEVWSVGDKKQHDALIAELRSGLVSLSIRILKPNGNYETVPFNPIASALPQAPAHIPVPASEPSPTESKTEETAISNKHIVQAGDKEMSDIAKHFHLKAETVMQPGEQDVDADIKDTVQFSNKALQESHIAEEKEETPVTLDDVMEKQAEEEEPEEEMPQPDMEQLAKEINELLSAKAYEEALKILVEVYGEEKITFKASALSRLKTFEAIVKKYKLDE